MARRRRDAGGMRRHVRRLGLVRLRRACDISLSRYQLPMPNTAKYTMTKATSEAATAGAASGDADSAVRSRP